MKLVISLILIIGIGTLGGLFTAPEIGGWYATLRKPSFQPPNSWFGPVWTVLYTMMAIAFFLVWRKPASEERRKAITIFVIQFVLNFFWSIIFFNRHEVGWALVEICVMWVCIVLTILRFGRVSAPAAWLLVPYLLWVSFATVLNAAIWKLN